MTVHNSDDGRNAGPVPPRRYASRTRARKPWRCSSCGAQIKPGEEYEYSYAHGGTDEQRRCRECAGYH